MVPPKRPIRRFDIFAEYNRLKDEQKGMPSDRANGYALWLAKVIAARKFAKTQETRAEMTELLGKAGDELQAGKEYLELAGEPQTGELFDRQVVERMGQDFYREVFSPAIQKAIAEHKSYEAILDELRAPWNMRRSARAA